MTTALAGDALRALGRGLVVFSGGRARTHTGVLGCHGGFGRLLLRVTPVHAHAMTLGHVVLGRNADCLERTRAHERVHVRQTEQFAALFPFAYLASSAFALLRGRHYHRDNWFERDARRSLNEWASVKLMAKGKGRLSLPDNPLCSCLTYLEEMQQSVPTRPNCCYMY
jgi:hypothetical protein